MTEKVLDANVFIHTAGLSVPFEDAVTVPAVEEELESEEVRERYEISEVAVYEPGKERVEKVEEKAEELREELSRADIQVLALALDRSAVVVTDDYGVQNVAEALGILYEEFRQEGIEKEIEWKKICSRCGADVEGEECDRCGGEPKKVPA